MKYNWKYIKSGRKNIKVEIVFCRGDKQVSIFTDLAYALQHQETHKDEMENDIKDYIKDQAGAITARWDNRKYEFKTQFIPKHEWVKLQKKLNKE